MPRKERLATIKQLEERRGSPLLCYINGDRENVSTRVAPDVVRVFYQHLEKMEGRHDNLDFLIYTRGGDVLTPWRLVNLIREYADHLTVLIPFRCYSAGTLMALGADEIIMGKMGELGPIDPSVANAFNPQDPINAAAKIPISVEDVSAFLSLAKEMAGLREAKEMVQVFEMLNDKVHPLALGNVYRNYVLIRSMAHKLLSLHLGEAEAGRKQEIIDNLTEKLYAHNHLISRREASEDIGLPIRYAEEDEERLLWDLYLQYEQDLKLRQHFNPVELLKEGQQEAAFEVSGGVIESAARLDSFMFYGVVNLAPTADKCSQVNINIQRQGWEKIDIEECKCAE